MLGLRDIHTHIVYGVDDGAQSFANMQAMLDEAVRNHVSSIFCTSHMTPGVEEFPAAKYERHLRLAQDYCTAQGYPLRLHTGAEILYTPVLRNYVSNNPLRTLGNSSFVLVEFVPSTPYDEIQEAVATLIGAGYDPILAHIERYEHLRGRKVAQLKRRFEVRYQVNCNSVLLGPNSLAGLRVRRWLRSRIIDYVASDTHNTRSRPNRMFDAWLTVRDLCGEDYANLLMADE